MKKIMHIQVPEEELQTLFFRQQSLNKSSEQENDMIRVQKEENGGICAVYIQ